MSDDRDDIVGFRDGSPIHRLEPKCWGTKFPDGTRCGEYGWHAKDCPERVESPNVEHLCEVMHDAYEAEAARVGWATQERSRVAWADVPEANKQTMRAAVRALLVELGTTP